MTKDDIAPTWDELQRVGWSWGSIPSEDLWWIDTDDGYDCHGGDWPSAALPCAIQPPDKSALWIYPPTRGVFESAHPQPRAFVTITWETQWRQIPTWTCTVPVETLREAARVAAAPCGLGGAKILVNDRDNERLWHAAGIVLADSTHHDDLDYCLHRWLMHVREETRHGRPGAVKPFRGFWPRLAPITRARRAKENDDGR